ncbi:MAG: transcriptional regulator [Alphaproteobacteria bacterium]|nr:MAG: transcriptional regulator [Alphaproteobacteria bacterium]
MGKAFEKIAGGFEDAIAFAGGDASRGREHPPLDVRAIRAATNKTQKEFAEAYRLPIGTVRDWEQKRRQPDAPARVLLHLIQAEPETVAQLVAKAEKHPA